MTVLGWHERLRVCEGVGVVRVRVRECVRDVSLLVCEGVDVLVRVRVRECVRDVSLLVCEGVGVVRMRVRECVRDVSLLVCEGVGVRFRSLTWPWFFGVLRSVC